MPTSALDLLDPAIRPLRDELARRELHAEVQVTFVCGEPDIRLVVCRRGEDGSAELLTSPAAEPTPVRWSAVRVRADSREVWQGPHRGTAPAAVADFLEALLSSCRESVGRRYTPLS